MTALWPSGSEIATDLILPFGYLYQVLLENCLMISFIRKSTSLGSYASAPKGSPGAFAAVRMAYVEAVPEWEYHLQTGLERGIVGERTE